MGPPWSGRACRVQRTWYSRRCGANACETEERGDIIDTAGTLVKTAEALVNAGADKVYACATHPVLSGQAIERISKSRLEQVIVTNTIPLTEKAKAEPKIIPLTIAGLLGRAIQSIHEETSVSSLFA